jgi:acetoacetyl-CoA synthetase
MSPAPKPPASAPFVPQIRLYQDWLARERGLRFDSYDALWRWSVADANAFWLSVWDFFEVCSPDVPTVALARNVMPGAPWFPGVRVNYAREAMRHVAPAHAAGQLAIVAENELGEVSEMTWPELRRQVASVALTLRSWGVQPGDRVAAYLPNTPATMVAALACMSIGAVWSVCAPDMGTAAVLDRFSQITPRVLIAVDGVHYGGRAMDRSEVVQGLKDSLPSVERLLLLHTPFASKKIASDSTWESAAAINDDEVARFEPEWLPFDHPIWIVYSSGTTGLPKPIVHGHGGILMTLLALKGLHNDIGASYEPNSMGERFHWYSSTGWVMWNAQLGGLATGSTICLYDGNPGGSKDHPDWGVLWRFAARHRVTFFGAGAAFYANCMKAHLDLTACGDLSRIRALGCTGSPLTAEVQRWGSDAFAALGTPDIWWCNISGGTDFCGSFIGGNRELPQVPGQMQCRQLGCGVEAWNEQGQPVVGEVGELVCTQPLPSMPLSFWGDEGGKRLYGSYFDTFAPGQGRLPGGGDGPADMGPVWRHGDWLQVLPDGGCIIYGRSDATINRHGLRMGTSEIYALVEALPEVLDALVVDLEYLGRPSHMPLFVALRPGMALDDALRDRIAHTIRTGLSPRFVPDEIVQVPEIPRTLSGKKQELPIKKLLLGQDVNKVLNPDAMANPGCLPVYLAYAAQHASKGAAPAVDG